MMTVLMIMNDSQIIFLKNLLTVHVIYLHNIKKV